MSVSDGPYNIPAKDRDDSAGWVLLLPTPEVDDRVLCLELDGIAYAHGVAYWYPAVTAVSRAARAGMVLVTEFRDGLPTACSEMAWSPGVPLPFGDGFFTGCIWRRSGGTGGRLAATGIPAAPGLLTNLRRLLRRGGFLYIDFDNRFSFQKFGALVRGQWRELAGGESQRVWRRRLATSGAVDVALYPFILERGRLSEIIPAGGHRPGRNAVRWRERLKVLLLQGAGARSFASAYGALLAPTARRESLLAAIMDRLNECPALAPAGRFRSGRVIVTPGKAFVECLPDAGSREALFVVVPLDETAVARRRRELGIIAQLKEAGFRIASLLPRVALELACRQRPVFVFSLIPGTTVDAPVVQLDAMTRRACELLIDFNRQSMCEGPMDRTAFQACLGDALDGVESRYAWARPAIGRLRTALELVLLGRDVSLVWLHGDYKLENLLFDTNTLEVTGVIDWELAAPCGVPLLDLLYLLAYNRVTRGEAASVLDVVEGPLLKSAWTPAEQAMIDGYLKALGLDPGCIRIIAAAFLVQHIGIRFAYPATDVAFERRVVRLLDRMAAGLETLPRAEMAVRSG